MIDYNSLWPESHVIRAREEGWDLALVVNEGDPVTKAFFMVFEARGSTKFDGRIAATRHVAEHARKGSKFHKKAVEAVLQSRMMTGSSTRRKKR